MRKVGKYEKMRKRALLQTYITSLLCLVLCVTMFFGTTAAWFTDTTTSQGNQIYVGKLNVELGFAAFSEKRVAPSYTMIPGEGESATDVPIFDKTIHWEPGYTAVRKFQLTEKGDLAFGYQLGIECNFADSTDENGVVSTVADKETIARAITVWNYVGEDAETYELLPESFDQMKAEKWEKVGTLYDVITEKLPVFKGSMEKEAVTKTKLDGEKVVADPAQAYHLIALNMDSTFADTSVQGKILDAMNIKLVATQLPSEQDAFGSNYDNLVYVEDKEDLQAALDNAIDGTTIVFAKDITGEVIATQKENVKITIDGNGKTLAGSITVNGRSSRFETAALTIKNVHFKADSITTDACINLGKKDDITNTRNTNHVTVSGCIFEIPNAVGISSYTGGDLNVTIENCVVKEVAHSLAQLKNVEKGLKVTGCQVNSKNGIGINNSPSMEMSDCNFKVRGYAVRFGESDNDINESFIIRNSKLSSNCEEPDDAVIVFRKGALNATLTLSNTMLAGPRDYLGSENATIIIEAN